MENLTPTSGSSCQRDNSEAEIRSVHGGKMRSWMGSDLVERWTILRIKPRVSMQDNFIPHPPLHWVILFLMTHGLHRLLSSISRRLLPASSALFRDIPSVVSTQGRAKTAAPQYNYGGYSLDRLPSP